jgi:hypothetical protein
MRLTPADAPQLAQRSVGFVQQKFGLELRYTAESLAFVEAVIDQIRETGATEQQASGLLVGLGCYAGEVLVRNARATWRCSTDVKSSARSRFPIVLTLAGATVCDPLARVFKLFADPSADSLASLYETAKGSGDVVAE